MTTMVSYSPTANVSGADTDGKLVTLWLEGKSTHTRRAYEHEVSRFLRFIDKPLATMTLTDLREYERTLEGSAATVTRALAVVKSLLGFGQRVGYLPVNVGAVARLKAPRNA